MAAMAPLTPPASTHPSPAANPSTQTRTNSASASSATPPPALGPSNPTPLNPFQVVPSWSTINGVSCPLHRNRPELQHRPIHLPFENRARRRPSMVHHHQSHPRQAVIHHRMLPQIPHRIRPVLIPYRHRSHQRLRPKPVIPTRLPNNPRLLTVIIRRIPVPAPIPQLVQRHRVPGVTPATAPKSYATLAKSPASPPSTAPPPHPP